MANPHPTPFKKTGAAANPNGAPKRDWTWSGVLEKAVQEELNGVALKEAVAKSLIREALKGNVVATKELMNRMDGMPQQEIDLKGKIDHIIISREPIKELDAS